MRAAVSVKLCSAWISTLRSPFSPAASVSLVLQGLEFAFCSAALLSPLHANTNNMRMLILTTMRTTAHLRYGMNPYNRERIRGGLSPLGDRSSFCFDRSFRFASPKKSQRVTQQSSHMFARTGGNYYCQDTLKRLVNASALSEARFHKSVKSGRGAPRAFDRA